MVPQEDKQTLYKETMKYLQVFTARTRTLLRNPQQNKRFTEKEIKNTAAEKTTSAVVFFVVQERYHENFVIYDKDLCKHWKNGFFCDKIDRKSVLWTHTSQTVTGKREREKVDYEPGSST